MAEHAIVTPPAQRSSARLGSFLLGERVPEIGERINGAIFATATGAPDGAHPGAAGIAICVSLPEGDPGALDQAKALLSRLPSLASDRTVPVLEADIAGRIAYMVEARILGERLSARLARERKLAPWQVAVVIADVAASLAAAHAQRISHGAVVPHVVWIDGQGHAHLGGFGLLGRGPARDQWLLAALAFELLAGIPWSPEYAGDATGMLLVERVRGRTNGLTEQIGRAVARGLEREPEAQFPDVLAFARAVSDSVLDSAVELAAGAWEAISRGDLTMAAILVEMTSTYNPAQSELAVLRVRLNGGAMRDANYATQSLAGPAAAIPMTAPDIAAVVAGQAPISPTVGLGVVGAPALGIDTVPPSAPFNAGSAAPRPAPAPPGGPHGVIAPGFANPALGASGMPTPGMPYPAGATAPSKPARNPWVIFAIGACVCVIILTVLVALTFSTV